MLINVESQYISIVKRGGLIWKLYK